MQHMKCLLLMMGMMFAITALGGTEREGGDEVALNFQAVAAQAISRLPANALSVFDMKKLRETLDHALYFVVEEALFVTLKPGAKEIQNSVAVNDSSTQTIYINRNRWLELKDSQLRMKLALHELLGLIKVERTGDYHVSVLMESLPRLGGSPQTVELYSQFYNNTKQGFDLDSAKRRCNFEKTLFSEKYALVYCSYLKKKIPHKITSEGNRSTKVSYETAYGLKVMGINPYSLNRWITVFSSKDFLDGKYGALEYSTADQALEACSMELAMSLSSEPLWINAQCFTVQEQDLFFFEIRILE